MHGSQCEAEASSSEPLGVETPLWFAVGRSKYVGIDDSPSDIPRPRSRLGVTGMGAMVARWEIRFVPLFFSRRLSSILT